MYERMVFFPNEFFDEYPKLQLKNIYTLLRHNQYKSAKALEELELYYNWAENKDEIAELYAQIKALIYKWRIIHEGYEEENENGTGA